MTHDEIEKHLPDWAVLVKKLYKEAEKEKEEKMRNGLPEKT